MCENQTASSTTQQQLTVGLWAVQQSRRMRTEPGLVHQGRLKEVIRKKCVPPGPIGDTLEFRTVSLWVNMNTVSPWVNMRTVYGSTWTPQVHIHKAYMTSPWGSLPWCPAERFSPRAGSAEPSASLRAHVPLWIASGRTWPSSAEPCHLCQNSRTARQRTKQLQKDVHYSHWSMTGSGQTLMALDKSCSPYRQIFYMDINIRLSL